MKKIKFMLAILGLTLMGLATRSLADDTNLVTITGTMVCGKCTLHLVKSCQNVVQVKGDDGKMINYFLKQNDVSTAAHDPICEGGSEKVKVTGTLKEEDDKKVLTPTKIDVIKS
jgi:hypothetical protein